MFVVGGPARPVPLTLVTDAFIVRGTVETRHRRITDMLNATDDDFLVLSDVVFDSFGSRDQATKADFAQINLAAMLFAVANEPVESAPELRVSKVPEQAMITIPPFRVVGHIHLMPQRSLAEALGQLTGRFLPVTEATYWSDSVGEARQTAELVAVNHARAQIMAPHRELDPWAGLDRASEGGVAIPSDAVGGEGADPAWPETDLRG